MTHTISRLNTALEGRYRIESELGEGGMATVYLADDLKHGRKVALKVLKPELAAVVGAERFLAEIKTTANLQHPHILPLFDSGEADGILFYVMPYVEGESLRQWLQRERQLSVPDAVRIATDVAEALDYAHRHGVVHRDIKPANVLIVDGRPTIADFGIALAVGSAAGDRLTETGLSVGTPYYMSPEQATGDEHVGPATDIYALSAVLYEMLTGDPPYVGRTAQAVLGKILQSAPVSATESRPTTPASIDAVVRKGLERLPADRFATAGELAQALSDDHFRHDPGGVAASVLATAPHTPDQSLPWLLIIGGGVAALAVGFAGGVWMAGEPSTTLSSVNDTPVVVLMDTHAPHGVYDEQTLDDSGTNADRLNEVLRDLPVLLLKEPIGSTWDREEQILRQRPDLVVIHRSAFYHSMNLELGFGYPDMPTFDDDRAPRLYEYAENKLGAFFGFITQGRPSASFLVYSRGSPGGWQEEEFRAAWVARLEGRFPLLQGRLHTMNVPGGDENGSWYDAETIRILRENVEQILDLGAN